MTPPAGAEGSAGAPAGVLDELETWLEASWDPDLTVAEWWLRLGEAGWANPSLPEGAFGRGLSRAESLQVARRIAGHGALGGPVGLGAMMAAPTITTHGTPAQIDSFVRAIVTGRAGWCQLFSEPAAGSDLAGITTRAVRDGDDWIVNGQKVWTSTGQWADMGMLLARSDPDVPKHAGITYFAIDMHQPGVEVRPLREMTGHALFNEVFLTDARVSVSAVIGDPGAGWAVANTTLSYERAGLSGGGGGGSGGVIPGSVAGYLDRRAGDFVAPPRRPSSSGRRRRTGTADLLIALARGAGKAADPRFRQRLVRLHTLGEISRFNDERVKALRAAGADLPGAGNMGKLTMSEIMRQTRDLGLDVVGPQGTLHGYDEDGQRVVAEATANPFLHGVTSTALFAQAPAIYGGTDQIQRNILAERVLGLPKEPASDREVPFASLPRNG